MPSHILGLVLLLSCCPPSRTANPPQVDQKLRQELQIMMKVDQDMRTEFIKWMKKKGLTDTVMLKKDDPQIKRFEEVDRKNTARMKKIVDKYGWPGKSLVGTDGANAAWLLVQHADKDPDFQKKCLGLMKQLAKGEVSGQHVAYLTDRVLVGEKKKQVYGTQCEIIKGAVKFRPIEDEANVDKRRAELGLPPLGEYTKQIEQAYLPRAKPNK